MARIDREFDGDPERLVLTGCITSAEVLNHVASVWREPGLFKSAWANIVCRWCVEHHKECGGQPPGKDITTRYLMWTATEPDRTTDSLVSTLLEGLSAEYEQRQRELNVPYVLGVANRLFDENRFDQVVTEAQDLRQRGKIQEAGATLLKWQSVAIAPGSETPWYGDVKEVEALYPKDNQPPPDPRLVVYPGALGNFFKHNFERHGFVSFLAPTGRGKTFWLQDVGFRALLNHKRVAFFSVGDMTIQQFERRLACRDAQHPWQSTNRDGSWPCVVRKPMKVAPPAGVGLPPQVAYQERTFKGPSQARTILDAHQGLVNKSFKMRSPYMLSSHPNLTLTVPDLSKKLKEWRQRRGFVADVVIVDYADNLKPVNERQDHRIQVMWTWKMLRALSQEFDCLVVTATQAKADSFKLKEGAVLGMYHFSDSRTKMDDVTAMYGLNQTNDEKKLQVWRVNQVKTRDSDGNQTDVVWVAGCLPIASPAEASFW